MKNIAWTKEETLLALNLYLKLPFGQFYSQNKDVMKLASMIGRTPSSVSMKLSNFARLDPFHKNRGVKGLAHGAKLEEEVWNEYIENRGEVMFKSEQLLTEIQGEVLEFKFNDVLQDLPLMKGEEKIRAVKTRVNQRVFREIVLANYSSKCIISKISIPDLLIASHIIPWSKDENERLNPENGLCLSAIHDRAFDKGLLGIDIDYKILLSNKIKEHYQQPFFETYFGQFENKLIEQAGKYLPRKAFLEYHLENIFQKD